MICFRDRTFCSARCETVECGRRWTASLQAAARQWWNPRSDPNLDDTLPVAFANFIPSCAVFRAPDGEASRELEPQEVNPS